MTFIVNIIVIKNHQIYKNQNKMDNKQFFSIGLPKWPECQVWGEDITPEQAAQIIIRTQNFYFSTNDWVFEKQLLNVLGVDYNDKYPHYDWDQMEKVAKKYQCLDLEYLENQRIVSAYIGGPHGWMNWDGTIAQFGKNIGKWPNVETVYNEWCEIAKTFPFLKLTCQLYDGESCENGTCAVIQFDIKNGSVTMSVPPRNPAGKKDCDEKIKAMDFSPYSTRERGCTIEQFQKALDITQKFL